MYILASDLFRKDINTYLKLDIRVQGKFLAFRYVCIQRIFQNKSEDYLYL